MNAHPPLTWGPKPHCAGLFARVLEAEEAHVVLTSKGWSASAGSARLTPPIPGPLWASQAAAMDAVARAVGCERPAPICPACHGYGSADGLPCGTHERDFGADAPAACGACGGSGLYTYRAVGDPTPRRHDHHRVYPVVIDTNGTVEWRTEGVPDGGPWLSEGPPISLDRHNFRCVPIPFLDEDKS